MRINFIAMCMALTVEAVRLENEPDVHAQADVENEDFMDMLSSALGCKERSPQPNYCPPTIAPAVVAPLDPKTAKAPVAEGDHHASSKAG